MNGRSGKAAVTAFATVVGISWNFRSRKTGRPTSASRRTPLGPQAVKNSRPQLDPADQPSECPRQVEGHVIVYGIERDVDTLPRLDAHGPSRSWTHVPRFGNIAGYGQWCPSRYYRRLAPPPRPSSLVACRAVRRRQLAATGSSRSSQRFPALPASRGYRSARDVRPPTG